MEKFLKQAPGTKNELKPKKGAVWHRGSVLASHPAALGLYPGFFTAQFVNSKDQKSYPPNAHAKDFENTVQQKPELSS